MIPLFATTAETNLALVAGIAVICCLVWLGLKSIASQPRIPDPWSEEISRAMDEEGAVPLCIHCLEPHDEMEHICTHCGGPVGPCTSMMPPLFYLSKGYILRTGSTGNFRISPLFVAGYFMCGLVAYTFISPLALCVPVYWGPLFLNVGRLMSVKRVDEPPVVASQ